MKFIFHILPPKERTYQTPKNGQSSEDWLFYFPLCFFLISLYASANILISDSGMFINSLYDKQPSEIIITSKISFFMSYVCFLSRFRKSMISSPEEEEINQRKNLIGHSLPPFFPIHYHK